MVFYKKQTYLHPLGEALKMLKSLIHNHLTLFLNFKYHKQDKWMLVINTNRCHTYLITDLT